MQSRCDVHSHEHQQERAADSSQRPLPGVRPGLSHGSGGSESTRAIIGPRSVGYALRPAALVKGPSVFLTWPNVDHFEPSPSVVRAVHTIRSVVHNCSVSAAAPFASPRETSASLGSPWNAARRREAKSAFCSFSTDSRWLEL
jgi:hypothetical protein